MNPIRFFWKVVNATVIALSKSPLHVILSNNVVVLHVKGKKTGKIYKIPVSFLELEPDKLCCVTDRENIWWKNLIGSQFSKTRFKGRLLDSTLTATIDNQVQIEEYLGALCRHSRVDGFFAKVSYQNGEPVKQDIMTAARKMVAITVSFQK